MAVFALVAVQATASGQGGQEAPLEGGVENDSVANVENIRASRVLHLEQELARLNDVITDAPSAHHHGRASILFRLCRFSEAIGDYDMGIRYGRPHDTDSCWERGLAMYYGGDFRGGAAQFFRYHQVGATDIENGIWRFLCIAEEEGIGKARETMFAYPRKLRKPFPALLALYMGNGESEAVFTEAGDGVSSEEERRARLFYAHYYVGKYHEISGREALARKHVLASLKYVIPHFMYACAEIDAARLRLQGERLIQSGE